MGFTAIAMHQYREFSDCKETSPSSKIHFWKSYPKQVNAKAVKCTHSITDDPSVRRNY